MSNNYDELLAYVIDHFDDDVFDAVATLNGLRAAAQRNVFRATKKRIASQQARARKLERQRKSTHARDDYARTRPLNQKGARGDAVRRIRGLIKDKTDMARISKRLVIEIAADVLECSEDEIDELIQYGYRLYAAELSMIFARP